MRETKRTTCLRSGPRRGVILILTLVVLVVLTTMLYTLTSKVHTARRRQEYLIDYQAARYACDSAVKYAMADIANLKLELITRDKYLDFSDIFTLSREELDEVMAQWAELLAIELNDEDNEDPIDTQWIFKEDPYQSDLGDMMGGMFDFMFGEDTESVSEDANDMSGGGLGGLGGLFGGGAEEDRTQTADPNEYDGMDIEVDPNNLIVPGPYGPPWPLVRVPVDVDIDGTHVTIEIMDENAKLPLTWAIIGDEAVQREALTAIQTFCEWMQMEPYDITILMEELEQVRVKKEFKVNPEPVKLVTKTEEKREEEKKPDPRSRTSRSRSRTVTRRTPAKPATQTEERAAIMHQTDFAKLLHSTVIDLEKLDTPLADTGTRFESARKYLALWGSQRVNVNTAPRHVLEAAFTFGGDARNVTQAVIQERQLKPFESMDDLKDRLYGYADVIERAKDFICTETQYFAVKVTARKGTASATAVATVIKDGDQVQRIAILNY